MKIKYIDKLHKKLKEDTDLQVKVASGAVIGFMVTLYISGIILANKAHESAIIESEILKTPYVIENNESYKLKDIYILYKDDDIRICRREDVLKSVSSGYDLAKSITIGTLISDSSYDYLYKFYDLKTNELVAATDFPQNSSDEIHEEFIEEHMRFMNGYKFLNLGEVMKFDAYEDHEKIDQEYIDEYIENKRFLGR